MKDNLGQVCVKDGLLSFQGKTETIALISLEKGQFCPVLTLLFHLPVGIRCGYPFGTGRVNERSVTTLQ